MIWESFLFLNPRGMGWICETTLQKLDRCDLSIELGISG